MPAAPTTTYTNLNGNSHITTFDLSSRTVSSRGELGYAESSSCDSFGNGCPSSVQDEFG